MQNAPTRSELDSHRKHHGPRSARTSNPNTALGKSLPMFLIKTEIGPFVLAGKCMQYFGLKTVVSFVLGATLVYGYAFFKPLPYLPKPLSESSALVTTQPPVKSEPSAKEIRLHGVVQDRFGHPVKEQFMVGVLLKRFGPLRNVDGSFAIDVPKSSSYDLALWNMGGKMVQVYDGYPVERDGDGYILPPMLFPETMANTFSTKPSGRMVPAGSSGQ